MKYLFIFAAPLFLSACHPDAPLPAQTEQIEGVLERAKHEVVSATDKAVIKANEQVVSASKQAESVASVDVDEVLERVEPVVLTAVQHVGDRAGGSLTSLISDQGNNESLITGCYVIKIADGDTATCLTDGDKKQIKIRFAQIDAPESKQDFGNRSKQALSDYIFNKHINLKVHENDRYGRSVAEVYIGGVNVNKLMVQEGYAWAYKEYNKDLEYLQLQEVAKVQKKGLWSHKNPIYPQDFRRQQAETRANAR